MEALEVTGLSICIALIVLVALYYILSSYLWKRLPVLKTDDVFLYVGFSLAFSLVGYNIGLFTGLSLSPVIQFVIPALLTFITAFITYIFLVKDTKHLTAYRAAWIIIVFNVGLFAGAGIGMEKRGEYEREDYNQELRKELFLKKLDYYTKYKMDTGFERIIVPYVEAKKTDTAIVDSKSVPPIKQ